MVEARDEARAVVEAQLQRGGGLGVVDALPLAGGVLGGGGWGGRGGGAGREGAAGAAECDVPGVFGLFGVGWARMGVGEGPKESGC